MHPFFIPVPIPILLDDAPIHVQKPISLEDGPDYEGKQLKSDNKGKVSLTQLVFIPVGFAVGVAIAITIFHFMPQLSDTYEDTTTPSLDTLYMQGSDNKLYVLNTTTGVATVIGSFTKYPELSQTNIPMHDVSCPDLTTNGYDESLHDDLALYMVLGFPPGTLNTYCPE